MFKDQNPPPPKKKAPKKVQKVPRTQTATALQKNWKFDLNQTANLIPGSVRMDYIVTPGPLRSGQLAIPFRR